MSGPTLVVGATGAFGSAVVFDLLAQGREVRALVRDPVVAGAKLGTRPGLKIMAGDVEDLPRLSAAGEGCGLIVHAVNYPYPLWDPHMRRATEHVIAVARAHGATILFPGNVYGLGPQTEGPVPETAPNRPTTRKGRLRAELEEMLSEAAAQGVRVLIVRAGDFFGPTARNRLVGPIFGNAARGRPIYAVGRLDVPHEWAYLPDLARAASALLERSDALAPFEIVHVPGYVAETERAFLCRVAERAGHPELKIRRLPWALVAALGLADPVLRELIELRYLFDDTVVLDGAKLARLLPDFRPTPIDEAIALTLRSHRV